MAETLPQAESNVLRNTAILAGAAILGVALYQKLRPEKHFDHGDNYFDIIANLDQCIRESVGEDVRYGMAGGGASYALSKDGTRLESIKIIPPDDIDKSQYRPDNGTLADVDILVYTKDVAVVKAVKRSLVPDKKILESDSSTEEEKQRELAKPGARLKIGVTGLSDGVEFTEERTSLRDKAFHLLAKDWVSHRLEFDDGRRTFNIAGVSVDLPEEYFNPYYLVLKNGQEIPVLHPIIQVLCYASRASHGIRVRDIDKVEAIMDKIGAQFGAKLVWGDKKLTVSIELEEPINDGIQAAIDFANLKNELRWPKTKESLGRVEAGILAARIALHRKADTWKIVEQFGQGGWIYDHLLSRFTGEDQEAD